MCEVDPGRGFCVPEPIGPKTTCPVLVDLAEPELESVFVMQDRTVKPAVFKDWLAVVRLFDTPQDALDLVRLGDGVVVHEQLFL